MNAGKKKSNGHKKDCSCPICKNMKKAKNKKNKKGGADEDIKEMASVLEVEKTDNNNLDVSKDEEYENLDDIPVSKGGKKRGTRKTNKFNLLKLFKNMKKTRKNKKRKTSRKY